MKPRIIFLTLGTRGDLFPFIGMALEMKRRGFAVLMLSAEPFRAACEAEGIPFEAVESEEAFRAATSNPKLWNPLHGIQIYFKHAVILPARKIIDTVGRIAKEQPSVLVYHNMIMGGLIAHEKFGIPALSISLFPYSRMSIIDPPKDTPGRNAMLKFIGPRGRALALGGYIAYLNHLLSPLNKIRAELNLPKVKNIMGKWRNTATVNIDLWPEWFGPEKPDWNVKAVRTGFVDYSGTPSKYTESPEIRALMERDPVVFAMGSEMNQDPTDQIKLFKGACEILGRPGVLISASHRGKPPLKISENFYVIDAPHAEIFPRASVILTHGGVGTVSRVSSLGKPHLITPFAFDHFDNAYQIERVGAGIVIPYASLTVKKLASGLAKLANSEEIAEAAKGLAGKMKNEPGAKLAADIIERTAKAAFPE